MIDRRSMLGWSLGAGVGLLAPGAALASGHRSVRRHARHLRPHEAVAPHAGAVRYDQVRMEPLKLEPVSAGPRRLILRNLHTEETLDAVYWDNGAYVPDALEAVNHVLRDFRTGETHAIEPRLLDLLTDLQTSVEARSAFQVICGYRSPATNAMLSAESPEVAKHSLHMDGMAIDICLEDIGLDRLHQAALDLGRGGVGYYPQSKFVHVDVGPVRHWQGV